MKKILLICLLFSFSANAQNPLKGLSSEQIAKHFFEEMKKKKEDDKIFIRAGSASCTTIKSVKKLNSMIIDNLEITKTTLDRLNCSLLDGKAIGALVKQEGNIFFVVHTLPFSPGNVSWGWFDGRFLMTVGDRKKLN